MSSLLRAPFPWFGGKSRAAPLVWKRFGQVHNYVEPFLGSGAVLLGNPHPARVETVNDKDCYVANFHRALQAQPEAVAHHADWPVNEADLHARHRWLVSQADFRERMRREPDFFDVKLAGWWVWGISQWIGSGWCAEPGWEALGMGDKPSEHAKRPSLDKPGRGVHQLGARDGSLTRAVEWTGRTNAGRAARGVHVLAHQKPNLRGDGGATGMGVHASGRRGGVLEWMRALAERLRYVRVCCGDWERVVTPSVLHLGGVTGVFLDPPYSAEAGRDPSLYAQEDLGVAHAVRDWAVAHGDDSSLRIALCGYEGEHELPASWRCEAWKAPGGYAAAGGNTTNAARERIWFSPSCLRPETTLLGLMGVAS